MSRIWLDVTTILGWQRPAVGIVRVEAECASYVLEGKDIPIAFCRFDRTAGYQKVERSEVLSAIERIKGKQGVSAKAIKSSADNAMGEAREQRFKALVLRLINALPHKLRTKAMEFAVRRKGAYDLALLAFREFRSAIRIFVRPSESGSYVRSQLQDQVEKATERPVAPFASADVYVSLGLDWDLKDFVYLYEQKRNIGFKALLCCYDIIPIKLPHLCVGDVAASFARYFADLAWCADEVLCISDCTKNDLHSLLSELGAPIPSLSIIKLGCQVPTVATDIESPEVAEVVGQRYILFVSTIERRKNHEVLYRAYCRLLEQGEKSLPLLIFVGMRGWGVSDFIADLQLDPRTRGLIKILNHVSDSDLLKLYQKALFTVYPSLYEGWGLPVAESLAAGKFCLASNAASIPEIGGDLIEYIDPWDVPSWAERLAWYFRHPEDLAQKELQIRHEFAAIKWEETALDVLNRASLLRNAEGRSTCATEAYPPATSLKTKKEYWDE